MSAKIWLLKRSALFRWLLGRENEYDVHSPGAPRDMTGILKLIEEHPGPNEKLIAMRRRYEEVQRARKERSN